MTRSLYRRELRKPDGRRLWLYDRAPLDETIVAVAPDATKATSNPHLKYHPLRGEWVTYAQHRQTRTFLPPADYNPLAPTQTGKAPTELPAGHYRVAVFENRFPSFSADAHDPPVSYVPTRPASGACEVVVFTQAPDTSLGELPIDDVKMVVEVWADRTRELGSRPEVKYVFPFENRGVEVGVTLPHPHGQIYAYPFVPPLPARELEMQRAYLAETGEGLLAHVLREERADGRRVVVEQDLALAFVPTFARYAYELWIAPTEPRETVADLEPAEVDAFARALKQGLQRLDRLFARPMPYVLAMHQAPTDGEAHPEAHVHIQIYPALRMRDRLKYLAGSELGAGTFTADTLPEEKAAELRAVEVSS